MGCEEDVLTVAKKLDKLIATKSTDHSSAVDLLKTLQNLPMTLEVLQKTRIGMIVNNFRKSTTAEEIVTLSKALIKNWKKLLAENNTPNNSSSKSDKIDSKDDSSRDSFSDSQNIDASKPREDMDTTNGTSDTVDPIRLKCRELIKNALKTGEMPEDSKDVDALAIAVETCIHAEFKNTDTKYKNRVRSRVSNLRDQKNPKFRENVLIGALDPSRVATMTSEEMASDDMKNLRAKFTKEGIEDHQMAMQGGTKSSLLKCPRCLKKDCTYNQVQTRSADEPMTTFVLCNSCGNRWKFC